MHKTLGEQLAALKKAAASTSGPQGSGTKPGPKVQTVTQKPVVQRKPGTMVRQAQPTGPSRAVTPASGATASASGRPAGRPPGGPTQVPRPAAAPVVGVRPVQSHLTSAPAAAGPVVPRRRDVKPVQLPAEPPGGKRRPGVNIGLDYGTSTTKVCVRAALGFDEETPTYPVYWGSDGASGTLCPSLVGARDGMLFFGAPAQECPPEQRFEHLKVCLACQIEQPAEFAKGRCPVSPKLAPEKRRCASGLAVDGAHVTPADLVTLYLAWVMGETAKRLPEGLVGGMDAPRLTCSVGLPIDQLDKGSRLRKSYKTITSNAWRLRGAVTQGIPADCGVGWLRSLPNPLGDPPVMSIDVETCPETVAAVMSFVNGPDAKMGMYALVDIGAWTTDMSVFRLSDVSQRTEGIRTTAVYTARTYRVAAGRIDQIVRDMMCEHWEAMGLPPVRDTESVLVAVREMRELGEEGGEWRDPEKVLRPMLPAAFTFGRESVANTVAQHFVHTWDRALPKESSLSLPSWRALDVLLLGGGSEEPAFGRSLNALGRARSIQLLAPASARTWGGTKLGAKLSRRMQVAAGLAIPRALWTKQFTPSEVDIPRDPAKPRREVREWDLNMYD